MDDRTKALLDLAQAAGVNTDDMMSSLSRLRDELGKVINDLREARNEADGSDAPLYWNGVNGWTVSTKAGKEVRQSQEGIFILPRKVDTFFLADEFGIPGLPEIFDADRYAASGVFFTPDEARRLANLLIEAAETIDD